MKRIIIVGTGMGAAAARRLINDSSIEVMAFADNDPAKHGEFCGAPVLSVERAVGLCPDCALIAIMGEGRARAVEEQFVALGFSGEIRQLFEYRSQIDIRAGAFSLMADQIRERGVEGDIAELGVYRGEFARVLNARFPDRKLYLFDTFQGFDSRDIKKEATGGYSVAAEGDFSDAEAEAVLASLPHPEMAVMRKGYFPDTATDLPKSFALVSLDADLYEPTYAGLSVFYPRLSRGGVIIVHDYNSARFKGAGEAARRFFTEHSIYPLPLPDLHGTAVVIKP